MLSSNILEDQNLIPGSDQESRVDHPSSDEFSKQSDDLLVTACLQGEERAWELLLDRYSRLIYTIPLRFGFSHAIADEIFQEVCLILLEKLDTLRNRQRIHPWLVTVTRRACIQRWRTQDETDSAEVNAQADPTISPLEDEIILLEQQTLLYQALAKLNPRCQQLLQALFFEKPTPSYEAIAEALNMQLGSIGPTRARCLDRLRQEIAALDD